MYIKQQYSLWDLFQQRYLVPQIIIGLLAGALLAWLSPTVAQSAGIVGDLFLGALKAAAPLLVFTLVTAAITRHQAGQKTSIKPIILLYLLGTFSAAAIAVMVSIHFPTTLKLVNQDIAILAPQSINQVIKKLLISFVDNPVDALLKANFIGILAWAIGLGLTLRHATATTKTVVNDLAKAVTHIVKLIIRCAPLGIFGIVANTFAVTGFYQLLDYLHLIMVLISCMLVVALVINPLIVFIMIKRNPYPLVFTCLRESGITAFFTRSSAANVPVNLALCQKLGLNKDTYSISIPLGATINMAGAAITITVLTLAAVNTLNIPVDLLTALLLSILATLCACGASGVAGGSLLLIPLACSLFNIPVDVAMKVVSVGFTIGVIQDSVETALNSSTDVLFTATACIAAENQEHHN